MLPNPKLDWHDTGVIRILKLMAPAIFGVSVSQINLLLDTVLASFLPTGSVSWLYYSDRLSELPLGVFAIAVATVILPSLSRNHASASAKEFNATLNWALVCVMAIALPACLALIILAEPLITSLFQYREFTLLDAKMASYSLMAYACGLPFFMLIKVLAPGYFARQDTITPAKIGIVAMVSNMLLNFAFMLPLHHYFQIGHAGLALATATSAALNASLLWVGLRRKNILHLLPTTLPLLLKIGFASLCMAACLLFSLQWLHDLASWEWWLRVAVILGECLAGIGVYMLILLLVGVRPRAFAPNLASNH